MLFRVFLRGRPGRDTYDNTPAIKATFLAEIRFLNYCTPDSLGRTFVMSRRHWTVSRARLSDGHYWCYTTSIYIIIEGVHVDLFCYTYGLTFHIRISINHSLLTITLITHY